MRVAGVILAGGRSRRMGTDKALVPLAGRPMIAHVIERLAPQVDTLAINCNADPATLAAFGVPVLPDIRGGHRGPLSGILTGLVWAAGLPGITHLLTAPTDTPFLPRDLGSRLAAEGGGLVLAQSASGAHPVAGLWPVTLAPELAHWLDTGASLSVMAFADRHSARWAGFAPETPDAPDPFFNANTPAELAEAGAALARGAVR